MLFSLYTCRYIGSVVEFPGNGIVLATLPGRNSHGIWYTREVLIVCPD